MQASLRLGFGLTVGWLVMGIEKVPPLTTAFVAAATGQPAGSSVCASPANKIVAENCRPGSPREEWDVFSLGDPMIQGFATDMSVNLGEAVSFKIKTHSPKYRIDIYRMGWYGGSGARRLDSIRPTVPLPQAQPECLVHNATRLVDCGNWQVSASWRVPADAVSGVYVARLVREDDDPESWRSEGDTNPPSQRPAPAPHAYGANGLGTLRDALKEKRASHIVFVVRDDEARSAILFQTSDTTWVAFNRYGGYSLYGAFPPTLPIGGGGGGGGAIPTPNIRQRAYRVSYNRPLVNRDGFVNEQFFNAEYPAVRWLERNGYDVSYFAGVDSDRRGDRIREHRVFMSVGHDAYWSAAQRRHVEAARDAGVHLAFLSGGASFWRTRFEPSFDRAGTPHRTLVSYKETHADGKIDSVIDDWTGAWRDSREFNPIGPKPENALTGTIATVGGFRNDRLAVPSAYSRLRFWRNTEVANAANGHVVVLGKGVVGHEWDEDLDNGARPNGLIRLSQTMVDNVAYVQDLGNTYDSGTATHALTLYRAPSGALVFSAASPQYSWGLDDLHNYFTGPGRVRPDPHGAVRAIQQATVNLLADMNVVPASLQQELRPAEPSRDRSGPVASISTTSDDGHREGAVTVRVSGTAVDVEGVVAGVEVSIDGGANWHPAEGTTSWTFERRVASLFDAIVVVSRATDDSANTGPASAPVVIRDARITVQGSAAGQSTSAAALADPCAVPSNKIVAENCRPGNPSTQWDVNGAGDPSIQGFSTDVSYNVGETAAFKILTDSSRYRIDVYRMGYYAGLGARRVATVRPSVALPQQQPPCTTDWSVRLYDCGNWGVSATWLVPTDAVSGVYVARLVREDPGGGTWRMDNSREPGARPQPMPHAYGAQGFGKLRNPIEEPRASHIVFLVRDDTSRADIVMQTSDPTWAAYNTYGLGSTYNGLTSAGESGGRVARANKASLNRPNTNRGGGPVNQFFNVEYALVRWLERNGYDTTYFAGLDTDRRGHLLTNHKLFISIGHDEYWSAAQRRNVEAARDAGVNLAFMSGNEVFWKTRYEPSIDATKTDYRTLVVYKESHSVDTPTGEIQPSRKIDPMADVWTGTWRDSSPSNPEGAKPENALTGTIFTVNANRQDPLGVPAKYGKLRFWRNTDVAKLESGQVAILGNGILGHEWDEDLDNGFRPDGLIRLSEITVDGVPYPTDWGTVYDAGTATHALTLYRAKSGALVFGAGCVQYGWGLDNFHDNATALNGNRSNPYSHRVSADPYGPVKDMQQATVNLFADMGIQPLTLQKDLIPATRSSDKTPPTSAVLTPPSRDIASDVLRIAGTATDVGGVVAAVEVSLDGGRTWRRAVGTDRWELDVPIPRGTTAITALSRAIDDSVNVEVPLKGFRLISR